MTLAHVPAEVVIGLQQRLDAQAKKCKELQYLIAQQESKIASMSESHRELQWSFDRDSGYIIKYMRALACKVRKLRELDEKLLAVNDDRDNKIKEIASLKYIKKISIRRRLKTSGPNLPCAPSSTYHF